MPRIKLTLIGAGSRFTFGVVADLIRCPAFAGSAIALVDTDPDALDLSARIVGRLASGTGADLRVERSPHRRDLLPGSDFVLNSISVGEPWARERDVAIGERYGIYQPTSQTVGPAGFARGLRVIPHAGAIARDVADLCPDAIVLNLANPLSAVCRSMIRGTGLTVIGLCEQWKVTLRPFGETLNASPDALDCLSVGINHLTWALALHHEGRDLLPEALRRLHAPGGKPILDALPVSREIYDAFGLWPTGTEDHIAEFFPYFLTPETRGGAAYGLVTRHTTQEQADARRAERHALADGKTPIDSLLGPSGESAVEIISALTGVSEPGLQTVNVPNAGLIDNLPEDAVVELPAHVGPAGVRGLKVGPLPQPVAQFLSARAAQHELLVDAALSGDRRLALQGLLLDAQIVSLSAARSILSESLTANAEWLPKFQ
ncbi:MAG: hypothetical protein EXS64_07490 [Candidatus Latescibacteria bacterium]|nr:hypothetical protein [Candidatus Latescibacterota bacterium]